MSYKIDNSVLDEIQKIAPKGTLYFLILHKKQKGSDIVAVIKEGKNIIYGIVLYSEVYPKQIGEKIKLDRSRVHDILTKEFAEVCKTL